MTPAAPHADDYHRLSSAERRIVRQVEATCRATGQLRIDTIALQRLERAACKERSLGPLGRWLRRSRLSAQDRVERLRSTLRHPSRTGAQLPTGCRPPRAGTS